MVTKQKPLLLFFAAVLFSITTAFSQGGTTGPLTWSFSAADSTLTISGTGAMPNYSSQTDVPWYAYKGGIKIVSLSSGVTNIGNYAFYGCTKLYSIDLSHISTIGYTAFWNCNGIKYLTEIPNVTTIGGWAFHYCYGLLSVTIPNGVTYIGDGAFQNCENLTTVNFNATNCTTMGGSSYSVFEGCNKLFTLNIGGSVTRTPADAFRYCSYLKNIYVYRNIPPIAFNNSTFYGVNKNTCILHVPTGTTGAYSTANGWMEFFNIVDDVTVPTYTISGQVTLNSNPLSGVTMAYTGGSTVTNPSGQYSITVDAGATVTITPSLSGYTFTPPSVTCTNVTGNITNQNFTAQLAFVPVTNITGVPTSATATSPLTLTGTVVPSNATNQNITWSLVNAGGTGATITGGNTLNTTTSGTVVVEAKIVNGLSPTQNYMQNCTIVVSKAVLSGTVTISGNAVYDQTLTANISNFSSTPPIANLGTLSYQWRRGTTNISGATGTTYKLVQADIGHQINIVVTSANCSGNVISPNTATVTKATQTAPSAPTLNSKTATSITLVAVSGCEYNINGGTYQSSPTFGGLTPSTPYTFTQRKAETNTHLASPASPSATFTTDAGTPPVLTGTVTISGNAVFGQTLTAIPNLTSTPPGDLGEIVYQWKRSGTPVGANSATYLLAEADISHTMSVTVTAANCTGSVSSSTTAVVSKATQTAPDKPTLNSKTATSITLNIVSGCEYSINGSAWQSSPTFAGLTPNTTYAFTQRKAETTTHLASPASLPANFTTDNTTVPLYTIVSYVNNPAFGTITPYGENHVEEGASIVFTITAYAGYKIESVMIDGVNYGAIETYTFQNVRENGIIAVVLVQDVGVDENALSGIKVFPNPTTGELRIDNGQLTIKGVEIYDVSGRKLFEQKENLTDLWSYNLTVFPAGVYFVRIQTEAGEVVKKVVKQ